MDRPISVNLGNTTHIKAQPTSSLFETSEFPQEAEDTFAQINNSSNGNGKAPAKRKAPTNGDDSAVTTNNKPVASNKKTKKRESKAEPEEEKAVETAEAEEDQENPWAQDTDNARKARRAQSKATARAEVSV